MSTEKPLPTFAVGGKTAPAPDALSAPSAGGGKLAPPLTPSTDLHSFLHGKQPASCDPPGGAGGAGDGSSTVQKDRYEFLRSKLRYEFITPEDWVGDEVVKPSDMISAFVEVTSAHGVPHVAFARGPIKRIVWSMLTLATFSGLMYQLAIVSMRYMSYEVAVGVSIQHANDVQFPAVTICNMSPIRLSAVAGMTQLGGSAGTASSTTGKRRKKRDTTTPSNCCCTCCAAVNWTTSADACGVCGAGLPTSGACSANQATTSAPNPPQTTTAAQAMASLMGTQTTQKGPAPVANNEATTQNAQTTQGQAAAAPVLQQNAAFSNQEALTESLAALSPAERASLGFSMNDLVLTCTYAGSNCNPIWFTSVQNPILGNCYIFNSGWNDTTPVISYKTGRVFGLDMILNIEQDQYVEGAGDTAGLRLLVHSPTTMPFPEDEGVTISPGHSTSIGLQMNQITRLGLPYDECVDTSDQVHDFSRNVYEQLYPGTFYTTEACMRTCYQRNVISQCRCGDSNYPLSGIAFNNTINTSWPPCNSSNTTQADCQAQVLTLYNNNQLSCNCPNICNETQFTTSLSIGMWPSNVQREAVLSSVANLVPFNVYDNVTYKSNLIQLEIYFEEFNYQVISESPAYTLAQYFSDIGGSLGLYMGMSFMSWIEFFELLTDIVIYTMITHCRSCRRNKVTAAGPGCNQPDMEMAGPPPPSWSSGMPPGSRPRPGALNSIANRRRRRMDAIDSYRDVMLNF